MLDTGSAADTASEVETLPNGDEIVIVIRLHRIALASSLAASFWCHVKVHVPALAQRSIMRSMVVLLWGAVVRGTRLGVCTSRQSLEWDGRAIETAEFLLRT